MNQLIIDRSKWRTGGNSFETKFGETKLLNDKGMMCCLGFYCLQIGNKIESEIFDIALPSSLNSEKGIESLVTSTFRQTDFTESAIYINDSEFLSNEDREIKIHQHFIKINVDVKFVNEYPS